MHQTDKKPRTGKIELGGLELKGERRAAENLLHLLQNKVITALCKPGFNSAQGCAVLTSSFFWLPVTKVMAPRRVGAGSVMINR
jgi:hypothetical protein